MFWLKRKRVPPNTVNEPVCCTQTSKPSDLHDLRQDLPVKLVFAGWCIVVTVHDIPQNALPSFLIFTLEEGALMPVFLHIAPGQLSSIRPPP